MTGICTEQVCDTAKRRIPCHDVCGVPCAGIAIEIANLSDDVCLGEDACHRTCLIANDDETDLRVGKQPRQLRQKRVHGHRAQPRPRRFNAAHQFCIQLALSGSKRQASVVVFAHPSETIRGHLSVMTGQGWANLSSSLKQTS